LISAISGLMGQVEGKAAGVPLYWRGVRVKTIVTCR
jgi:hypothetical protein